MVWLHAHWLSILIDILIFGVGGAIVGLAVAAFFVGLIATFILQLFCGSR